MYCRSKIIHFLLYSFDECSYKNLHGWKINYGANKTCHMKGIFLLVSLIVNVAIVVAMHVYSYSMATSNPTVLLCVSSLCYGTDSSHQKQVRAFYRHIVPIPIPHTCRATVRIPVLLFPYQPLYTSEHRHLTL